MKKDAKREIRTANQYEIREINTEDKKKVVIEGYFAKFNNPTELWDGFIEIIASGAFDDTIADGHNIFMLYHHDWHKPLASTKTGLLELEVDNVGLKFKATINSNLSYAKDVIELVNDGLIQGCSFGFECLDEDNIYDRGTDVNTRTLRKVNLFEGSVLCIPAYDDTTVFTRAKQILAGEKNKLQEERELEELKVDLELYKLI
ncbi:MULTISPECIES: HK97 family phage prohead protease [Psychrilyobacter]|uniref:HK97 family phage prohead protease n=1 Tax=Psychrilyobacter piezotolerans TaxID=2293438 RepID=A0ABX9KIN6_9FUSO|nr:MULTISPECIES: HK97 family phage prohead protease [Psychrilyobacter]MCS5420764.1 HK97 family phage prohead protease [Psychrilyobacter sp. S5]NDI77442.1 HK97 family phage prohead protease [Psychrilyobacter piezotolerans]RDE63745.1 HK97 family phage prohead protease [Psychrilyobacter sp. S5]REI42089.1 HK97 family phage prohead protease [Psychrilyobacter piezotolerans]